MELREKPNCHGVSAAPVDIEQCGPRGRAENCVPLSVGRNIRTWEEYKDMGGI